MTTTDTTSTHPFTKSGMGPAPFRFIGTAQIPSNELAGQNPEAHRNMMRALPRNLKGGCGTCYHCGMAIMSIFIVQNADGDRFGVGCDCIAKTDHVEKQVKTAAHNAKLKRNRELARARKQQKDAEKAAMIADSLTLTTGEHRGLTAQQLVDTAPEYAAWVLKREAFTGHVAFWAQLEQTDMAVAYRAEQAAEQAAAAKAADQLAPLAAQLMGHGNFAESIAADLRSGRRPQGRAFSITCDILAKLHGRRNSKAYDVRYDEVAALLEG